MKKQWKTLMQLRFFVKSRKETKAKASRRKSNINEDAVKLIHELEVHQIELRCK
jgi:hypothetical protein